MRAVRTGGVTRRGLLALALAVLVLTGAPGAPAGDAGSLPEGWSDARGEVSSQPAPLAEVRTDRVAGAPVRLTITRIDVAARVVPVAAHGSGVLTPPADPALVGWWSDGARAESPGGAVLMAGHTVRGGDGVFDDLAALRPGDPVEVATGHGTVSYAVARVRKLTRDELAEAAPRLFGAGGRPRLVLVTCTGWDAGEYVANTVVVAVPSGSGEATPWPQVGTGDP